MHMQLESSLFTVQHSTPNQSVHANHTLYFYHLMYAFHIVILVLAAASAAVPALSAPLMCVLAPLSLAIPANLLIALATPLAPPHLPHATPRPLVTR
jgi:hypothetical protein